MRIPSGVTDQYIYFIGVDATDLKTRETGLSSFTVYRSRNGAAAAVFTTPTINETDATNMPGVYELLLDEDMSIDSGNQSEEVCLHITQASMAPVTRVYELYRSTVTPGETLTVASSALGTDTVTAASIAADALTKIRSVVSGTSDSGSTTTMVDAARTEADTDYWRGATILFTSGTLAGQARLITAFTPGTDTITFTPAATQAVSTHTYEIFVDSHSILASLTHTGASVQILAGGIGTTALAAGAIHTTAIATDAITAATLATDATTEIQNGLATAANLATVDTVVDAIKVQTDKLTFGVTNVLNANVTHVNETEVTGNGETGTEWGPV